MGDALLKRARRFEIHMGEIGVHESLVGLHQRGEVLWHPGGFQEQMIQAERDIECGFAVPGAFRVQQYRASRAHHDVLGADVAMHQDLPVALRQLDEIEQTRGQYRVHPRGLDQIGLQTNRIEILVRGEASPKRLVVGRGLVYAAQHIADLPGHLGIDLAGEQGGFPVLVVARQILHDEAL
ncbi:hypothetical protein D3C87_1576620 [compost metagenome]